MQSISLKVILLKSLICKGLPSKDYKDYQRKCLILAFGWIFLCHLEGCDSINFIDKKISLLYIVLLLVMRIMH